MLIGMMSFVRLKATNLAINPLYIKILNIKIIQLNENYFSNSH